MTERSARHGPRATPREVADAVASALFLGYSAPMPGGDSRYSDVTAAHEARLLGVPALAASLSGAAASPVGQTVFEAVSGSVSVARYADLRAAGYLAPLARAALLGERLGRTLGGLSNEDAHRFARAGRRHSGTRCALPLPGGPGSPWPANTPEVSRSPGSSPVQPSSTPSSASRRPGPRSCRRTWRCSPR